MSEMKGKVCIVTGSNSGMGKETAMALASMGATVVMVVRNRERGEKAFVGCNSEDAWLDHRILEMEA